MAHRSIEFCSFGIQEDDLNQLNDHTDDDCIDQYLGRELIHPELINDGKHPDATKKALDVFRYHQIALKFILINHNSPQ